MSNNHNLSEEENINIINIDYNAAVQNDLLFIFVGAIIITASFLWKDVLTDIQDYYLPKAIPNNLFIRSLITVGVTIVLIAFAIYLRDRARRSGANINQNIIIPGLED